VSAEGRADTHEKFAEFEATAWVRLLAVGRAVAVLFLARRACAPRALGYHGTVHNGA